MRPRIPSLHEIPSRICFALAIAQKAPRSLQSQLSEAAAGIEMYERALVLNPKHMEALYNLAVVLAESRQLRRAVLTYEMAVLLRPDCAEAHNNLGVIHRELGNMERAMQCYLAALQLQPTFPQALNNVAVVLTAQVGCRLEVLSSCPSQSTVLLEGTKRLTPKFKAHTGY